MSEKSTKLKVEGLPQDTTESQLTVLLSNKRRQGGGPIENIELTKDTAIVTFKQSDAVDIILDRGDTVQLNDVTVMVSRYFDPDDTQSRMKRSRTRSKGNISAVAEEQEDLSDSEDSSEKVKMKSKKSLKETEKNKKTAGVKKQHCVPDEVAKPSRKMSKTYSQASDDEHINSSDENTSLPRESKNKSQKPVEDKTKNKSSMLPKEFSSAKENVAQKPKVSKYPISQDELSDTESESEKRNNRKHTSLKEISAKKKSSAGKKTTSDSDGDSQFYRKRSKANSRDINDDESSNESTESESSPEKSERKIDRSRKKSPKKTKSSVVNKVTHDSESSEEEHIEEPEKPWSTTIKARVSDITKTKDFYVMYFEDPHISQGEFYEESFLLDGLNRNLYVTFCDRKAAVATVGFKHKAESNLLKVELAKEEDFNTLVNLISVHGYAFSTPEQKRELKKTIEKISEMEVIDIIQEDETRSAIIVFKPDSCEDISAVTWQSVYFGTTRLIVAPVFQTNSIKVTGLYQSSSDDTLRRYMSNTKRSGGGEITTFQRLSKTEACIIFKGKESVDGVTTRKVHNLEGAELHVIAYYPCLTTEVYKKQVDALMEQSMNNTEALAGLHSAPSRQMYPRQHPRPSQMLQSRLNCKKVSLYSSVDRSSNKKSQYTIKLSKFGYEFLKRQDDALTKIMQSVHCQHTLVPGDMTGLMTLVLNWPHKIKYFEVAQMLDVGLEKVTNFLDTFTVAKFEIPEIFKFQQYYFKICEEKSLGFVIFFDQLDKLACAIISKQHEHVMEESMNTLYQTFMTSTHPTASDHNRSQMNVCQSGESRLGQHENSSQHTRTGMDSKFENLDYDGQQALQSVPNSNDRNHTSRKKKPAVPPKPRKEKNTTERKSENETVHLTLEQELELDEKDIIMLEKTHFHKDLEKKIMPLQIILNTEKMCAIIKSNDKRNIDQAQVELLKKVRDFTNIDITSSFSPEQLHLLNKEEVQNIINSAFLEMNYHAHFRCSNGTVSIYHVKDVDSNVLKEVAISQVIARKKSLDENMALILQSEKGRKFLADICELHDGVKVSSCVKLEDNCLHIVSPAKHLDIVLKALDRFLEENKSYDKVIPFSSGKQKFVHKCLSQDLAQISDSLIPLGAKIVDHADKYTVQGLKDGVIVGEKKLSQLSEKILVQDVTLKYFGIAEFLQTPEGESLLTRVEKAQPCVILQSDLPSGQGNAAAFRGKQLQSQTPPSLIALAKVGDCSVMFQQGDITSIDAEAIVNPLDSTLKCNSGLAKALLLKGGHSIQTELVSSRACVIPGDIIATSAGNMDKCKTIIHVVCPVFNTTEMDKLEGAADACFSYAANQRVKSIAIPALGTGNILKFDTFVACQRLIKALHRHLSSGDSTLRNIYLCDTQADHVKQLIERFKNTFGQDVENVGSLQETSKNVTAPPTPLPRTQVTRSQKDFRHIKVTCVLGEITKQKTDVIVVTVGKDLDLKKSQMTKDVVKYGGDIVQQELTSNYGDGIKPGEFGQTSAGNLQCKQIFYVRLHHWRGNSEEHMSKLVYKLLKNADEEGSASMAIPAIGTGNLGYPADIAADVITDTICQYAKDNPNSSLKQINLVVFPQATDVVQAFQAAMSGGRSRNADAGASGYTRSRNDDSGASGYTRSSRPESHPSELRMNSVTVKIKKGDITFEKCDAIVCAIRDSMDLSNSGAVSKNLLKKCGSALQDECTSKKDEMAQKGYITTSAPNLNCQHIYHVSMDQFSRSWNKCISQVLADAESQGYTSVGIPALGAGSRKADYKNIKESILQGVKYFSSKSKKTLQDVRLVVFSQEMLDEFLDADDGPRHASRDHQGDSLPKVMTVVSDHANLKIYADSHKNIASATKTLNEMVKAAFKEERDNDEKLKRLDKYQVRQLEDEGRKNHVKVTVSTEQGLITMSSFDKDGIFNVLKLLKTQLIAALEDHHNNLHRAVKSAIIWQFEQEKWRDFEPLLNSELESEFKKKTKQRTITDAKGHTYLIDFSAMKEFPLDSTGQPRGHGLNIRRYDRTREGEPLPKTWEHMKSNENLKLVTLQAGSPEFKAAEQRFIQGGANVPIKKIQRIQNKSIYQQFKAKKREMENRNPKGHENEKRLFHGTDAPSVTAITENGFNRSYCGKNAVVYGNGVYFAVQSAYSLTYAKPSAQGERFMYIARVLTGESTPSNSGMKYLPNKPGTNIPYDSGTAAVTSAVLTCVLISIALG